MWHRLADFASPGSEVALIVALHLAVKLKSAAHSDKLQAAPSRAFIRPMLARSGCPRWDRGASV